MTGMQCAASWLCLTVASAAPASADDKPKDPVPHLEFRIVANAKDDGDGLDAAAKYLKAANNDDKRSAQLQKLAEEGKPPSAGEASADAPLLKYVWVEVGPAELRTLRLIDGLPTADDDPLPKDIHNLLAEMGKKLRDRVAKAREAGEAVQLESPANSLLFCRACQNAKLSKEDREKKKNDYFLLTRLPEPDAAVTGVHLVSVKVGPDLDGRSSINFEMDKEGGDLFSELTSKNLPVDSDPLDPPPFYRSLTVIIDGKIFSAPRLTGRIQDKGQITGHFSSEEVDEIVKALRSDIPKDK